MNRLLAALGAAVALVLLVTLAGCGIPVDATPRPVTPPRGPFEGLAPTEPAPDGAGAVEEQLYLVRDDELVLVTRRVRAAPTIDAQTKDLVAGPTDTERDRGFTSALSGITVDVHLDNGAAIVVVDGPVDSGRNDQVLAFGQIVCTLTTRPDVTGVHFHQAGQQLGVPRADGSLSPGPLTATDYASLVAHA